MIDKPGIRGLTPWSGDDGLGGAFEGIEALAAGCCSPGLHPQRGVGRRGLSFGGHSPSWKDQLA